MLTSYIKVAMNRAHYEMLEDDGSFYGEIPQCRGVWANAATLENCRSELLEILEDWILIRIYEHLPLPKIDGIGVSIGKEKKTHRKKAKRTENRLPVS
jgi:predicted RNase H-like HicB family nuclease